MNTSKQDPNKNDVMDEVDDLTRFLDEDFDTDDVDLFEFTSEEESPLTQLKSIILSLDWDITDEILQDLIDEIDNLRHQELFESDKVSQVYLQGLDKIAHYIISEGAQVHPNSIKLLLTLYYDFEKILSSEHITGAEITALLKADVRKFKILQHQIAEKHGVKTSTTEDVTSPLPLSEHKDLLGVQAAILELDWEVTDDGLQNLSDLLEGLKTQYEDDHSIKVIIQGLSSLNSYLTEEKGRAHPETFSLIHNFYDALESLIEDEDLDDEKRKEILVDRVNQLNNLKYLIAQTYSTEDLAPEAITPVAEAEEVLSLDVDVTEAKELDLEKPAKDEEPAKPAAAVEMLIPIGNGEDDDEYDEPLVAEGEELPPALSDSSEEAGFGSSGDLEDPPEELEEKLDFFFGSDREEFEPEAIEKAAAQKAQEEHDEAPVAEEFEDAIAPALAGSVEDAGFTGAGEDMEAPPEELADKLDSFFGPDEENTPEVEDAVDAETPAETAEEPVVSFEGEEHEDDENLTPALAGSDEEIGFTGTGEGLEAPPEELADNLDAFFGPDDDKASEAEAEAAVEPPAETAEEPVVALEAEGEGEEEITPALAGSDEEAGFTGAGEDMGAPPEEITDKLDSFFGSEEEKEPEAEAAEADEEVLLTPALEESALLDTTESTPAVATAGEFQAAVEQMRSSYKELESTLRSEMESMRQEIESLRAQVNK